MKLSEYPIAAKWNKETKLYEGDTLPFEVIEEIIYSGIEDKGLSCKYCLCFGISRKVEMKARVETAVQLYREKRIRKVIFTGGKNGISTKKNNQTPNYINIEVGNISEIFEDEYSEAERMKEYAIQLGLPEEDIIVDINSNNTIEAFEYVKRILEKDKENTLIMVTTGYHLKRCLLGAMKWISKDFKYNMVCAPTGYFEKENYRNNPLGIQLANFDANHVVRQAREGKIYNASI